MDIKGHTVEIIWIELASDIAEEYYASFTLDRSAKKHLGMLSAQGGVEIESVAETDPDAIAKIWIDPVDGLTEAPPGAGSQAAKLNPAATEGAVDILLKLYTAYTEGDADLAEINPLILKPTGEVHALDAKVTLDDNSTFRHPDYEQYEASQVRDEREQAAYDKGLQYVGLDGYVGVIANGAGLAMSTVDIVNQVGGTPANFLDIGGGANADVMAGALEVINNDPNVRSIFINIFGGITKGDEVANGIVAAMDRVQIDVPIVIRLDGTNADEGRAILEPHLSDQLQMAADHGRSREDRRRPRGEVGERTMAIFVDETTKVVYQGLTGSQGRFYGLLNRDYGTQVVAGTNPKKAGTDVDGIPVYANVGRSRRGDRRHRLVHLHPRSRGAGRGDGGRRGRRDVHRGHHRGRARRTTRPGSSTSCGATSPTCGCSARTVPGIISPGKCQHRHHGRPHRQGPSERDAERRDREPLRHPHLPGALRAEAQRHRRHHLRRHRRRPGAGHELHRLPARPSRPTPTRRP